MCDWHYDNLHVLFGYYRLVFVPFEKFMVKAFDVVSTTKSRKKNHFNFVIIYANAMVQRWVYVSPILNGNLIHHRHWCHHWNGIGFGPFFFCGYNKLDLAFFNCSVFIFNKYFNGADVCRRPWTRIQNEWN